MFFMFYSGDHWNTHVRPGISIHKHSYYIFYLSFTNVCSQINRYPKQYRLVNIKRNIVFLFSGRLSSIAVVVVENEKYINVFLIFFFCVHMWFAHTNNTYCWVWPYISMTTYSSIVVCRIGVGFLVLVGWPAQ